MSGLDFLCVGDKVPILDRIISTAEESLWPAEWVSRGRRKRRLSNPYNGLGLSDGHHATQQRGGSGRKIPYAQPQGSAAPSRGDRFSAAPPAGARLVWRRSARHVRTRAVGVVAASSPSRPRAASRREALTWCAWGPNRCPKPLPDSHPNCDEHVPNPETSATPGKTFSTPSRIRTGVLLRESRAEGSRLKSPLAGLLEPIRGKPPRPRIVGSCARFRSVSAADRGLLPLCSAVGPSC